MKNAAVVIRNYTSAFPDPISITKNDTAVIIHCDLEYPGWVWITLPSGKAGWAPQQIFSPSAPMKLCVLEITPRMNYQSAATRKLLSSSL
ncbi:SH3 domain-containing protein [Rahnella rivi]|uniref:SH3 domain-containing protein n=1 Tax=Rahnella rivi TaxID=2816249 RepID=UPI001EE55F6F|nr:SH3 domain-containing protein [Rahnella rivi]